MADYDKDSLDQAHELIQVLRCGLELGCRAFDSKGKELKTVKEIVDKLAENDNIVFETDEDVIARYSKRN